MLIAQPASGTVWVAGSFGGGSHCPPSNRGLNYRRFHTYARPVHLRGGHVCGCGAHVTDDRWLSTELESGLAIKARRKELLQVAADSGSCVLVVRRGNKTAKRHDEGHLGPGPPASPASTHPSSTVTFSPASLQNVTAASEQPIAPQHASHSANHTAEHLLRAGRLSTIMQSSTVRQSTPFKHASITGQSGLASGDVHTQERANGAKRQRISEHGVLQGGSSSNNSSSSQSHGHGHSNAHDGNSIHSRHGSHSSGNPVQQVHSKDAHRLALSTLKVTDACVSTRHAAERQHIATCNLDGSGNSTALTQRYGREDMEVLDRERDLTWEDAEDLDHATDSSCGMVAPRNSAVVVSSAIPTAASMEQADTTASVLVQGMQSPAVLHSDLSSGKSSNLGATPNIIVGCDEADPVLHLEATSVPARVREPRACQGRDSAHIHGDLGSACSSTRAAVSAVERRMVCIDAYRNVYNDAPWMHGAVSHSCIEASEKMTERSASCQGISSRQPPVADERSSVPGERAETTVPAPKGSVPSRQGSQGGGINPGMSCMETGERVQERTASSQGTSSSQPSVRVHPRVVRVSRDTRAGSLGGCVAKLMRSEGVADVLIMGRPALKVAMYGLAIARSMLDEDGTGQDCVVLPSWLQVRGRHLSKRRLVMHVVSCPPGGGLAARSHAADCPPRVVSEPFGQDNNFSTNRMAKTMAKKLLREELVTYKAWSYDGLYKVVVALAAAHSILHLHSHGTLSLHAYPQLLSRNVNQESKSLFHLHVLLVPASQHLHAELHSFSAAGPSATCCGAAISASAASGAAISAAAGCAPMSYATAGSMTAGAWSAGTAAALPAPPVVAAAVALPAGSVSVGGPNAVGPVLRGGTAVEPGLRGGMLGSRGPSPAPLGDIAASAALPWKRWSSMLQAGVGMRPGPVGCKGRQGGILRGTQPAMDGSGKGSCRGAGGQGLGQAGYQGDASERQRVEGSVLGCDDDRAVGYDSEDEEVLLAGDGLEQRWGLEEGGYGNVSQGGERDGAASRNNLDSAVSMGSAAREGAGANHAAAHHDTSNCDVDQAAIGEVQMSESHSRTQQGMHLGILDPTAGSRLLRPHAQGSCAGSSAITMDALHDVPADIHAAVTYGAYMDACVARNSDGTSGMHPAASHNSSSLRNASDRTCTSNTFRSSTRDDGGGGMHAWLPGSNHVGRGLTGVGEVVAMACLPDSHASTLARDEAKFTAPRSGVVSHPLHHVNDADVCCSAQEPATTAGHMGRIAPRHVQPLHPTIHHAQASAPLQAVDTGISARSDPGRQNGDASSSKRQEKITTRHMVLQSTPKSAPPSDSQSTTRFTPQLATQPAPQPATQSTDQFAPESYSQSTTQSALQSHSQSTTQSSLQFSSQLLPPSAPPSTGPAGTTRQPSMAQRYTMGGSTLLSPSKQISADFLSFDAKLDGGLDVDSVLAMMHEEEEQAREHSPRQLARSGKKQQGPGSSSRVGKGTGGDQKKLDGR